MDAAELGNPKPPALRVVLTSHSYAPNVGGIETVSQLVAQGLAELGHHVVVITETSCTEPVADTAQHGPRILRRPNWLAAWRAFAQADVVLQSNVGLRRLWLPLAMRKPVVVVSHTWLRRPDGRVGWQDHLKRWALRRVSISAAVSGVLARHIGPGCRVLPNPYDSQRFRSPAAAQLTQRKGLLFLGRLVSDKGCDLAIATVAALRAQGLDLQLTVIGTGPEAMQLRQQAAELGVEANVVFKGLLRGQELVEEMHRHQVLMACSRWEEPFGLVALEALGTGLVPVVPGRGGLPEAVGTFGCIYAHGQADALLAATREALKWACSLDAHKESLAAHLAVHEPARVLAAYEALLQEATGHA